MVTKIINSLKSISNKTILGVLVGLTVLGIILHALSKGTALKARELNLKALLNEAMRKVKIKINDDKIEETKKPVVTVKDPKKVSEFYKNRWKK